MGLIEAGMTPDQRRRPETIYRLNCELEDLRGLHFAPDLDVHLQPTLYSRRKRNFHWLAVHPRSWTDTTATFWNQLREHVEKARGYFDTYASNAENRNKRKIQNSAQVLREFINASSYHSEAEVLDAVLQFYSTYPLDPDWFVDGILKRQVGAFRQRGKSSRLAMLEGRLEKGSDAPKLAGIIGWEERERQTGIELGSEDQRGQGKAEAWLEGILTVLMRLGTDPPTRVLVVPIYDHPPEYGGMLFGSLHALTRASTLDLKKTVGDSRLVNSGRLARALYSSAISLIASDAIYDAGGFVPTLIRHGAQEMARLHDWEQIVVFQGSELRWKWCRRGPNLGELVSCDGGGAHLPACEQDRPSIRALRDDPRWLLGKDLSWLADYHVANQLLEAEIFELKDYTFGFKFPDYVILNPQDHQDESAVANRYWRDRNDVWNILIPKVRAYIEQGRATSARDKLATVAIVGRNMSHNIGSHILSKLSDPQEVRKAPADAVVSALSTSVSASPAKPLDILGLRSIVDEALIEPSKQASTLNAYLRDRMDLIADLATTDPSWSMTMRFGDVIEGFTKQKLVRKWLTSGDANIETSVDAATNDQVEIPHGVVGMQAVYLILENILRNSHRHGHGAEKGNLLVRTLSDHEFSDCLIVDLIDQGSDTETLEKIKRNLAREFYEGGSLSRQAWGLKEMKIGAAFLRQRPTQLATHAADAEGTAGYPSTRQAAWIESHDHEGRLAWRLRFLRPKRAFLLCDIVPVTAEMLAMDGVATSSPNALTPAHLAAACKAYPMLVCLGDAANAFLDNCLKSSSSFRHRLPLRLLTDGRRRDGIVSRAAMTEADTGRLAELVTLGSGDAIERLLWSCWVAQLKAWAGFHSRMVICDGTLTHMLSPLVRPENYLVMPGDTGGDEVVYQRHVEGVAKDPAFKRRQFRCLVPYSADSEVFSVIKSAAAESSPSVLEGRMLEAGLVTVVVFDERLSDWCKENQRSARELGYSRVLVQEFTDDKNVQFTELDANAVTSLLDGATPALLVVSIHKNLLDGVVNEGGSEIAAGDRVAEWARAVQSIFPGRVIVAVHSGRGRVGSEFMLPFVEYSNIERFVRDSPNKFYLSNLVMALREN